MFYQISRAVIVTTASRTIILLVVLLCVLSVPYDLVHGFQPVTDKRDVAICIIWKTEIDIFSLSLSLYCAALSGTTECERYWEARSKMSTVL